MTHLNGSDDLSWVNQDQPGVGQSSGMDNSRACPDQPIPPILGEEKRALPSALQTLAEAASGATRCNAKLPWYAPHESVNKVKRIRLKKMSSAPPSWVGVPVANPLVTSVPLLDPRPAPVRDLFGGIVITRSPTLTGSNTAFMAYTINPPVVAEWLGDAPIDRLRESFKLQPVKLPELNRYRVLSEVHDFSVKNAQVRFRIGQQGRGLTTHSWQDVLSGSDFNVQTSTWSSN